MRLHQIPFLLVTAAILASCASYKQNVLFQVNADEARQLRDRAEDGYTIQANDYLSIEVYTNKGEKIIDPNLESFASDGTAAAARPSPQSYPVSPEGYARLPLIGEVKLDGLTLVKAEAILQKEYEKFYEQPYVVLKFVNKRAIVLGAPGGQVIPLTNDNMRLTEVLALAKGVTMDGRANNIRVIRGDEVLIADLSTFSGYQKGNVIIQPGDIIYVEPVHRPFIEALREYSPVITVVTSLATLIFVISQSN